MQPTSGPAAATPTIAGITPSAATGVLTVEGQHFSSGAVVSLNGAARTTRFASDRKLEAKLDAAVDTAGTRVAVTVKNPDGKESGAFSVTL